MCSYNEQDKEFHSTHQDLIHSVVVCTREKGRERRKGKREEEEGREGGKEEGKRGRGGREGGGGLHIVRGRRWVGTAQ